MISLSALTEVRSLVEEHGYFLLDDCFGLYVQYDFAERTALLEVLRSIVSGFPLSSVSSVDDDLYLPDISPRLKDFKRSYGKMELQELKAHSVFTHDMVLSEVKWYIDSAVLPSNAGLEFFDRLLDAMHAGKHVYVELGSEPNECSRPNISSDGGFLTLGRIRDPVRLFCGDLLRGPRFILLLFNTLETMERQRTAIQRLGVVEMSDPSPEIRFDIVHFLPRPLDAGMLPHLNAN